MVKRKARKPLGASCDRPQLSTTIRWKRIRPTCSKQPASISITPQPTSSPSPVSSSAPPSRVETHALSRGRARARARIYMCMYVRMVGLYTWLHGGLAPPGLGLYSHVRSDDPASQAGLPREYYTWRWRVHATRGGYLASTRGSGR